MSDKLSDLARSLLNYGGDVSKLLDGSSSEETVSYVENAGGILKLEELVLNSSTDIAVKDTEKAPTTSETIYPENIKDYQSQFGSSVKSTSVSSKPLIAAFSDQWGIYSIFQGSCAARSSSYQKNTEMLWRQVVLIIASHLDSGRPLTRILCLGGGPSCDTSPIIPYSTGILIIIEGFSFIESQPVMLIRYRSLSSPSDTKAEELGSGSGSGSGTDSETSKSQISLFLSIEEINYGLTVLDSNNELLDSKYIENWARLNDLQGQTSLFSPSLLRPPLAPPITPDTTGTLKDQQYRYRAGGMKRRNDLKGDGEVRIEEPTEKKRVINTRKEMIDRQTLLFKNREKTHRICMKADCKTIGTYYCGGCEDIFYCSRDHQKEDWLKFHSEECKAVEEGEGGGEGGDEGEVHGSTPVPAGSPSFDPMTAIHPTSIGPDGVIPEDIWDPDNPSIYLDLKQHYPEHEPIPVSLHPEHEKFWIRILVPLLGKGPQSLVDQEITMRMNVLEKHSAYAAIKECIKSKGYKGLKGFFPARRHGDFLRIYLELINIDQTW